MRSCITLLLLACFTFVKAQGEEPVLIQEMPVYESNTTESEDDTSKVYAIVEQMPQFPGGDDALLKFLTSNISYPAMERDSVLSGTVYIRFVVNEDGHVSDVTLLRGVYKGLNEEALRVVRKLPDFIPGRQYGKPVKVYFTIPIRFQLN